MCIIIFLIDILCRHFCTECVGRRRRGVYVGGVRGQHELSRSDVAESQCPGRETLEPTERQ